MIHRLTKSAVLFTALAVALSAAFPAIAAPSTSQGQISVVQVVQMLDKAPTDKTAHQVLTAYLAGVGEAAGAVASIGGASCGTSLSLSAADAREALRVAAVGQNPVEIPATPLIVRDMLDRAKCKR